MKQHRPLAALLLTALLLAGCGDDGDKDSDKDSDKSRGPDAGQPTGSSSPDPTDTGAEASDGDEVDDPLFRFNLPEGWEVFPLVDSDDGRAMFGRAPERQNKSKVIVESFTTVNFDDVTKLSPDVLDNWEQDSNGGQALPPTDWAGQRAYHFSSNDCSVGYCEQFGLNYKDNWVVITLDFVVPTSQYVGKLPEFEMTPAQIQETISAIEASWEWK